MLRKFSDNHVIIVGKLSFEEVIALLKQTDIFCFPTQYPEGFSTSVLEAIACQCYVITTRHGSSKELLPDESFGCVMQTGNQKELEDSIINTLDLGKEKRNKACKHAYDRLIELFTWEKTANRLEQIANNTDISF